MNYGKINKADVANGPGVRVSLYVSGCRNRCKGCFNPETWNFDYGQAYTVETLNKIIDALDHDYITGLTILGGDPFEPENLPIVSGLAFAVKYFLKNKTIWVYTGYHYEDLRDLEIMDYIDVLVDGPFIEREKDITLKFRGSRNQRVIDVKASRDSGVVQLLY